MTLGSSDKDEMSMDFGPADAGTDAPAPSSGAPEAEDTGPEDKGPALEDLLEKAIEEGDSGEPAPQAEGEKTEEADEAKPEDKPAEEAEDEEPPPFHKHPRWQKMIAERAADKEQIVARDAKIAELEPRAAEYEKVSSFLHQHQIADQEYNSLLEFAKETKTNPEKALEFLENYVQNFRLAMGKALPDDLSREVEDGVISQERAAELAVARAAQATAERAAEAARERETKVAQERQAAAQKVAVDQLAEQVNKLEANWRSTDPDYHAVRQAVNREFKLWLIDTGNAVKAGQRKPVTSQEVSEVATKIYQDERKRIDTLAGKPRTAKAVRTEAEGKSSAAAKKKPETEMDFLQAGLDAAAMDG